MIKVPAGDWELRNYTEGADFWRARIRDGVIELSHGGLRWCRLDDPNKWANTDLKHWLIAELENLKPTDKPKKIAKMRAVMVSVSVAHTIEQVKRALEVHNG